MGKQSKAQAQATAIEADDDDAIDAGDVAGAVAIEESLAGDVSASNNDAFAISIGAKLMTNDVVESLERYAIAKFHTATIPLRLFGQLCEALEHNDMSFDDLPIIGTTEKDVLGTNKRAEFWNIPGVGTQGQATKNRHRFFTIMFAQTEVGKKLIADKHLAEKTILNQEEKKTTVATIDRQYNDRVEALRKAVKLGQTINKVREKFPKLDVVILQTEDADGVMQIRDVSEPIVIRDKSNPLNWEPLGPTKFVKMPWDTIEKEGGKYTDFHKYYQKAKSKGSGSTRAAEVKITIANIQQLNSYANAFAALLDDENANLFAQLMKEANKDDATVVAIRDASVTLIRMAAATEAKLVAIQQREHEAIKAKAAATK